MVDRHVAARGIKDERVLQAMREVPRHRFVPQVVASKAYGPGALPIGAKQTISQPYIVARMIELLELRGNEKVLEIGTGTGYQAAVLSKLCAKVFTIERVNELALRAAELFRELKVHNASVKVFDGTYGWSDQAPFDRIIVAAAATGSAGAARAAARAHGQAGHADRPAGQSAAGARDPRRHGHQDRGLRHAPSSCRWSARFGWQGVGVS